MASVRAATAGGSGVGPAGSGNGGSGSAAAGNGGTGDSDGGAPDDGGITMTGDADPNSDPDIAGSFSITSQGFTVPPGAEVFKCQSFANPFQGQQVDIKTWEADMTAGSHHMFVFYSNGARDGALADCSGLQIQAFTFVAQGPHVFQTYPHGVGATIPTSMGFQINAHYINTTPQRSRRASR